MGSPAHVHIVSMQRRHSSNTGAPKCLQSAVRLAAGPSGFCVGYNSIVETVYSDKALIRQADGCATNALGNSDR